MDFFYFYLFLISGILVKCYKCFLVDVELDNGEIVIVYCFNIGFMIGVC